MAESLRIQLGKDQVERHQQTTRYTSPFQMRMNALAQAKKAGTYKKPKYVPWRNSIVIASRGIVSTPEQLKEIAGLQVVPAISTAIDLTAEDCISEHLELSSSLPEVKLCEILDEAKQYLIEKVIVEAMHPSLRSPSKIIRIAYFRITSDRQRINEVTQRRSRKSV